MNALQAEPSAFHSDGPFGDAERLARLTSDPEGLLYRHITHPAPKFCRNVAPVKSEGGERGGEFSRRDHHP